MTNTQESARCFAVLEGCYLNERPKALLTFAKENNLLNGTVTAANNESFPATQYCMELYCTATALLDELHLIEQLYGDKAKDEAFQKMMQDALQIVCLLLTMERMRRSCWNFGSELRYQIAYAGLKITRNEINAFLAQQGDFSFKSNSPNKGELMTKNPLAIVIYAADLFTMCGSLHGQLRPNIDTPVELLDKFNACWKEDCKASLEALMQCFCPAFLGNQAEMLAAFMDYLSNSDFYTAPASTKYHGSYPGGLAVHSCNVFARLVSLAKPQTEQEMGKLLLLAVGHDLCKVNVYKKYFSNEKVAGPAMRMNNSGAFEVDKYQTKQWADGSEYHYEEKLKYFFEDVLPQGHGQKSLNMLVGYFPMAVTEDMAAAIDGHMRDKESNPYCDYQMLRYPLCQYLHIADALATFMDEDKGA